MNTTASAAAAPAGSSSGSLTATPSPCRTGSATRMSKSDLAGTCGEDTGQRLLNIKLVFAAQQTTIATARQHCPGRRGCLHCNCCHKLLSSSVSPHSFLNPPACPMCWAPPAAGAADGQISCRSVARRWTGRAPPATATAPATPRSRHPQPLARSPLCSVVPPSGRAGVARRGAARLAEEDQREPGLPRPTGLRRRKQAGRPSRSLRKVTPRPPHGRRQVHDTARAGDATPLLQVLEQHLPFRQSCQALHSGRRRVQSIITFADGGASAARSGTQQARAPPLLQ